MRLFVAVQLSPDVKRALAQLQNRLCEAGVSARYVDPDNLHLTLAFIGEWPDDITPLLPRPEKPFPITLTHIGVFKRANVLWAGIAPSRELFDLAARVRTSLTAAGIPFDAGAFTPHITLARKPILPGDALPQIEIPPVVMTVDSVCLYWSHRIEGKLVYTVIGRSGICQEDDT